MKRKRKSFSKGRKKNHLKRKREGFKNKMQFLKSRKKSS
jgi:hypothetical protein